MKTNLIKRIQLVLLLAAVAVAGVAFLPATSEAGDPPEDCAWYCNGEGLPCGWYIDPQSGERVRCEQSVDCF